MWSLYLSKSFAHIDLPKLISNFSPTLQSHDMFIYIWAVLNSFSFPIWIVERLKTYSQFSVKRKETYLSMSPYGYYGDKLCPILMWTLQSLPPNQIIFIQNFILILFGGKVQKHSLLYIAASNAAVISFHFYIYKLIIN